MATHTVVEFNHDKMHEIVIAQDFGKTLYDLLRLAYIPTEHVPLMQRYGIKMIDQHHSSDCPFII